MKTIMCHIFDTTKDLEEACIGKIEMLDDEVVYSDTCASIGLYSDEWMPTDRESWTIIDEDKVYLFYRVGV